MISVERYAGEQASVNSYLLSDSKNVIVVDLLRNSSEAEALADHVQATGKKLSTIFISHGHPDHYIGSGVFHRRFPSVPIKVASSEIRDDIIGFSQWMDSVGWLDTEPTMKPKSGANFGGFDYAGAIEVLKEPFLRLPLEPTKIHVETDYPACECGHMTTLRIPQQRVLLAFDLAYNGVHAWCGPGVGKLEIRSWIQTLDRLAETTHQGAWTVYCGHGASGGAELISNMKKYLEMFLEVTSAAGSRKEATEKMKHVFPGYAQADFLLLHSINFHVKDAA
jgi:glyoxylase-like metal-dependent hydrolase (beta-lactamase superfamily II)